MRIDLAAQLGEYILSNSVEWQETKHKASLTNPWFTPEFIDLATGNIAKNFLDKAKLESWTSAYKIKNADPKKIGIVMAGNIPLVGFHDFLSVLISGHKAIIKASSKDEVLIKHLVQKLTEWNNELNEQVVFQEMLKACDAYIATGSNNSAKPFPVICCQISAPAAEASIKPPMAKAISIKKPPVYEMPLESLSYIKFCDKCVNLQACIEGDRQK